MPNEYDALIQDDLKANVRASLFAGSRNPADGEASLQKLADRWGMPVETVRAKKPEMELHDRLESFDYDTAIKENPKLSAWFSDPKNAAVSHDDFDNLSGAEKLMTHGRDYFGAAGQGVVGQGFGSLLSGTSTLLDVAARGIDRPVRAVFGEKVANAFWYEPPRVAGFAIDPFQALQDAGKGFKAVGNVMAPPKERQTLGTDVASGVGQIGFQIASYFLTGGASASAGMFAQGADIMADKTAKDIADPALRDTAILAGGVITKLTEQYGLDKILNRVPPEIKNRTLRFIADKVAAGGIEAGQEALEGLSHDLTRRLLTNGDAPLLDGVGREMSAAALSAAIVRSAMGIKGHRQAQQTQQFFEALGEQSTNSKLRERMPDRFKALMEKYTADGPVQNVFIPADKFQEYFQSQNIDPREAATEAGAKNFVEALASGGDVVIPMADFATHIAPTDHLQGLMQDLRLRQDEMTQREAKLAEANKEQSDKEHEANLAAINDAAKHANTLDTAIQRIVTDVEGQLVSRYDTNTARNMATVLRGMAVLATRANPNANPVEAAQALWGKYGLDIRANPLPSILTQAPDFNAQIDPMIDRLRSGDMPSEGLALGQSLAEFIRDSGGLKPVGETRDLDQNTERKPGQRNMVQETGKDLDAALQAAIEAGYFSGARDTSELTVSDFLEALGEDMRGNRVYSPQNEDANTHQTLRQLQALGDYIGEMGGDLSTMDNAAIKALIMPKEAQGYDQSATLRSGAETLAKYGLPLGGKYNTRDIAAALEARQREKYGKIDPTDRSDEAAGKIAEWMAEEVRFEMLHPRKSGVGWYSYKFQRALDIFGEEFPELKKDKDARATLTALIAITSDGQKVVPNFRMAVDLYRNFSKTGKFTTERGHSRMESIQGNIDLLQTMLDDMGPKAMRKYLLQEATVSELRQRAKAEGVEFKTDYQAHIKLPMAAVTFGPKLGAFYANLMGAHGYLTMDRWWSRTFNRYRGTLLQAPTKDGLKRIKELMGHPEWSDDQAIAATVEPRNSYEAKGFKDGTEIEKAANTVYKAAFENLEDAPFNATDRTFMLQSVDKAQQILAAEGRKISVADIQAVLWYYEKRLYGELGARQTADVSYEDAAKKVVGEQADAGDAGRSDARGPAEGAGQNDAGAAAGVSEEAVPPGLEPFDGSDVGTELYQSEQAPDIQVKQDDRGRLEILDPSNPGIRLHTDTDAEDGVHMGAYLEVLDDPKTIGGKGTATRLYLKALEIAQSNGMGWKSESIASDATHRMYARLTAMGIPFVQEGNAYVIEPEALADVDLAKMQASRGGTKLNQDKRGSIQFGADRKFQINLFEKADLSTFLHESGHFYLEVMGDLADDPNSDQQVKDDYAKILAYLGVASREEIQTEHHEKFARANEAYLFEGKAPSPELRGVFQRFRAWMKVIYGELKKLNVELSDEVRGVFDRIYATDSEIEQASQQAQIEHLFLDAASAGMTDAEFAAYRDTVAATTATAKEDLQTKLMRTEKLKREAWWRAERKVVAEQVAADYDALPAAQAFADMVAGDSQVKLNRAQLTERYGQDITKRLARGYGDGKGSVYSDEGIDVATAAELMGYANADDLINALVNLPNRKRYIAAESERVMAERHGDLLNDIALADEAMAALHNEKREQVLRIELRQMRKMWKAAEPALKVERDKQNAERRAAVDLSRAPAPEQLRAMASGIIGQKQVRDISPNTYLLAERKASRAAFAAMAKRDLAEAATQKQKELLNHYLYLEAGKAVKEAEKIRTYLTGFDTTKRRGELGKAGADYLDQIDAILERYELKRVSGKAIDKRQALAAWLDEQEAQGNAVAVPQQIQDESRRMNWKQAQMDELRAVQDAVRNIAHLASLKNKLIRKGKMVDFALVQGDLLAAVYSSGLKPTDDLRIVSKSSMTFKQKAAAAWRRFDAEHLKIEQLVSWLDGGKIDGPWARYFFDLADEAQTMEYDLHASVTAKIQALSDAMPKAWKLRLSERSTVRVPGFPDPLLYKDVLSIAMNMGNAQNMQRLADGYGWTATDFDAVRGAMTKQDWQYVQGMWDAIETLWPQMAALEKRQSGLEPEKVEALSFEAHGETWRGGYFPLVYDPRKSNAGEKQNREAESVQQFMSQGYGRAATNRGAAKARVEKLKAPILLDYEQVVTSHIAKVIKDISHREAVLSINKIMSDPSIKEALIERAGEARYTEMNRWLQVLVADRADTLHQASGLGRLAMKARTNMAIVSMGWKISTMMAQFAGFGPSSDLVKPQHLAKAMVQASLHPATTWQTVQQKSGEMRNRANTIDRDVRDALLRMRGVGGMSADVRRTAFYLTAMADRVVSIPTWLGGYNQALVEGKSEEDAIRSGDRAVRLSQGAGGAKDLVAVQRNNELMKLLTMYYTPFSVLYARLRDVGHQTSNQGVSYLPAAAARLLALVVLPAVLGDILAGRGPDDDEDETWWAIRKMLMYPIATIPVLRDFSAHFEAAVINASGEGTVKYAPDYKLSPIVSAINKIAQTLERIPAAIRGEREMDKTAWDVFESSGYIFGLPTGQARITGEYLEDLLTGDAEPENAGEIMRDALFRRPPQR
jgi:hypothetical protein